MRPLLALILVCAVVPASANEPCMNILVETAGTSDIVLLSPAGWPLVEELQGVTIAIQLVDCAGIPIQWYPPQDIWLDSFVPGEITLCTPRGSNPPYGTDATGSTSFEGTLLAGGGYTASGAMVFVGGQPASLDTPLPIQFVSPDLNGDLEVDLKDLAIFGFDWQTDAARSDFDENGIVDLPDFSHLGVQFGTACR